jgi:hypothetical protein
VTATLIRGGLRQPSLAEYQILAERGLAALVELYKSGIVRRTQGFFDCCPPFLPESEPAPGWSWIFVDEQPSTEEIAERLGPMLGALAHEWAHTPAVPGDQPRVVSTIAAGHLVSRGFFSSPQGGWRTIQYGNLRAALQLLEKRGVVVHRGRREENDRGLPPGLVGPPGQPPEAVDLWEPVPMAPPAKVA